MDVPDVGSSNPFPAELKGGGVVVDDQCGWGIKDKS